MKVSSFAVFEAFTFLGRLLLCFPLLVVTFGDEKPEMIFRSFFKYIFRYT